MGNVTALQWNLIIEFFSKVWIFVTAREFVNHSAVWPPIMLLMGIPPYVEAFY